MVEFVVDASVAVKWLVEEADTQVATDFYLDHFEHLHAPELILIETAGALVRRVNEGKLSHSEAAEGLERLRSWRAAGLSLYPVGDDLLRDGTLIAKSIGHPLKAASILLWLTGLRARSQLAT